MLTPFLPECIEGLNSISEGFNEFMRFRSDKQTRNIIVKNREQETIFLNLDVFVTSSLHS